MVFGSNPAFDLARQLLENFDPSKAASGAEAICPHPTHLLSGTSE
jgi:hypothetical protein